MKKFTELFESYQNMNDNPGNDLLTTGVSNHYTPVENILTNIRNLFCVKRGILAQKAPDGVSIVLSSEFFKNPEKINQLLDFTISDVDHTSLKSYIFSQGLNKMTIVRRSPIGQYDVYFSATDLKTADVPSENNTCTCQDKCCPNCNEEPCVCELPKVRYYESFDECEIVSVLINERADDEDELSEITKQKVEKIITDDNKKSAAKKLSEIIAKEITLPDNIYFAAVQDKNGKESIALRWKYKSARPFGEKIEITRSIMNIYGVGNDAVWVDVYKTKPIKFGIPTEIDELIKNILDIIGAKSTDNNAVWKIHPESSDEDKEDKDDTDDVNDSNDKNDNEKVNKEDTIEDENNKDNDVKDVKSEDNTKEENNDDK